MAKKDKITIRLPPPVNRLGEEFVTVFKKRRAGPTDARRRRVRDVATGRSRKPRNAKEKAEDNPVFQWMELEVDNADPCHFCSEPATRRVVGAGRDVALCSACASEVLQDKRKIVPVKTANRTYDNPWKESDLATHSPCPRCGGDGVLPPFPHVQGGTCFRCQGSGLAPRDWRSSDPERFDLLGAPVRVYTVTGALRVLVRQKDFDQSGPQMLALDHPYVSTFFRNPDSVYGALLTKGGWTASPLVTPPLSSLLEAFPDYAVLQSNEIPSTPTARRRWEERKDLIRRASAQLARRLIDALREHYK